MSISYSRRMGNARRSFIREILKVTEDPEIISFAGGLPNPRLFPVEQIAQAAAKVLRDDGENVLQYSTTEGYLPLREYVAERYSRKRGVSIHPDEVLLISGSQQGIDLVGKAILDPGDGVVIERPGYLGAIQAFALFEPEFRSVPLEEEGMNPEYLDREMKSGAVKIVHVVPNFQNPSGITYHGTRRMEVAGILESTQAVVVEDDPYGELRFVGKNLPSLKKYLNKQVIMLGSFSKIITPGLRLGWMVAPREIMEKIVIAKQAADLHTNTFSQRVVYQYLLDNAIDAHIAAIRKAYKRQRDTMVSLLETHAPAEVHFTRPEGGMFLWVTIPDGFSVQNLFEEAVREKVAFVPGCAFYVDGGGEYCFRLNFSNTDEGRIENGIIRLTEIMKSFLTRSVREEKGDRHAR